MKNMLFFLSENSQFLEVKFSIYLNRRVFLMVASVNGHLRPDQPAQSLYCSQMPEGPFSNSEAHKTKSYLITL